MANLRKYAPFFLMVALILALAFSAGSAEASARTANWVVSVTYQNVGDAPATLVVNFYEEGSSTPVAYDPLNGGTLAPGAGRSFFIGRVTGLSDGFKGNAVISSDQPLVSTVVQFSQDPGFRMRLLSNGMQSSDTSDQYLIATVLKNRFQRTTVFSIQNTEAESIEATVRFYDADNSGALASTVVHTIPAYSSKYIEMDVQVDTGIAAATFNGSAIVTAVKASDDSPAQIVGAASELYVDRNVAANFEGVPYSRAANTINMATGLCESFGLDTFYAVSNASLSDSASITVNYFNTNGSAAGTDGPYNIGAGQKRSIRTCDAVSSGFTGSAVVTSTGAPIVVIGKAQNSINAGTAGTLNVFTAFLGEAGGASEQAIPFVRWANNTDFFAASNPGEKQRAYIAVQNLEASQILVDAKYYDKNGQLVNTHTLTIPANSKGNTNASLASALGQNGMLPGSFGYYTDGTFGGAVTLAANSANPGAEFIGIVRVQHPGAGEDVNAVPVP
jgi:hypothetical protein